jgi:hypothetical protein
MNGYAALVAEADDCGCSSNARPKNASNRDKTRQKNAQRQTPDGSATYDWALDFEPLALPPDLPPVILVELVAGLVWVGEVVAWAGAGGAVCGRGVSRRWIARCCRGAGRSYKDWQACCGAREINLGD